MYSMDSSIYVPAISARPESSCSRSTLQATFTRGLARHAFMPHIWFGLQFSGVRVQVGSSGCCS